MPTVVVTGATGAVGSAAVLELQRRRAQVVSLTRPAFDLSSMASVRAAARELNRSVRHIDARLNIAAVYRPVYQKSGGGLASRLATDHLGPCRPPSPARRGGSSRARGASTRRNRRSTSASKASCGREARSWWSWKTGSEFFVRRSQLPHNSEEG